MRTPNKNEAEAIYYIDNYFNIHEEVEKNSVGLSDAEKSFITAMTMASLVTNRAIMLEAQRPPLTTERPDRIIPNDIKKLLDKT